MTTHNHTTQEESRLIPFRMNVGVAKKLVKVLSEMDLSLLNDLQALADERRSFESFQNEKLWKLLRY